MCLNGATVKFIISDNCSENHQSENRQTLSIIMKCFCWMHFVHFVPLFTEHMGCAVSDETIFKTIIQFTFVSWKCLGKLVVYFQFNICWKNKVKA